MSLPAPSGELWDREPAVGAVRERSSQGQSGVHHNFVEILDVNFVDDGCYTIVHRQAAELVKRMRLLVATIVSIFSRFHLSVNVAKGKTEVMLALRGENATAEREKLRGADGLWLDIDDDERQAHCKVHVVSEYQHLGTWVSLRLKCMRDAKHKEDQAMASCSALAVKVFGNRRIRTRLKTALMRSLVLSRSSFNLHISVPRPWLLKRLNRVHMRVLRRIAGCINGIDTDGVGQLHHSNRAVRQMLGEPSIDCIAARARLKYWRRRHWLAKFVGMSQWKR